MTRTRRTKDQESQMESPLASKTDPRSSHACDDPEPTSAPFEPFRAKHEETSKCFVYALALLVAVSAVALIFSLIFLRASAPASRLTSVTVKNLAHASRRVNKTSSGNATTSVVVTSLSVTLTASVEVENANFGRFEYDSSTASFFFEGVEIGRGAVARGRVGGRGTGVARVAVEVRREVDNSTSFRVGVESGAVRLTSYGELRGRVRLINRLEKKEVSVFSCTMTLNLRNRTVQDLVC